MEFTFKTVVVVVIILVAAFVFASIMLGWSGQTNDIVNATLSPFIDLVLRR
jgi:hypothetical protein